MTDEVDGSSGLEAVLLAHRGQLLRFLETLGAGEAAEDLFQELWINLRARPIPPVGRPLSYLYRAAHNLLRDRYRSARQARIRDRDWQQLTGQNDVDLHPPAVERATMARQLLDDLDRAFATLDPRISACLRMHRLEGASQKGVAIALGVSLSVPSEMLEEPDVRSALALVAPRTRGEVAAHPGSALSDAFRLIDEHPELFPQTSSGRWVGNPAFRVDDHDS